MKKIFIILISTVLVIVIALVSYITRGNTSVSSLPNTSFSSANGTQIVEITAKGGYAPRTTLAKAEMPTVIKVKTNGTFDCSSALTIPSLGITKHLPPSGETSIEIPAQKQGTTLRGLCAMGMYNFTVNFN